MLPWIQVSRDFECEVCMQTSLSQIFPGQGESSPESTLYAVVSALHI